MCVIVVGRVRIHRPIKSSSSILHCNNKTFLRATPLPHRPGPLVVIYVLWPSQCQEEAVGPHWSQTATAAANQNQKRLNTRRTDRWTDVGGRELGMKSQKQRRLPGRGWWRVVVGPTHPHADLQAHILRLVISRALLPQPPLLLLTRSHALIFSQVIWITTLHMARWGRFVRRGLRGGGVRQPTS